jgi:hypothetical protein
LEECIMQGPTQPQTISAVHRVLHRKIEKTSEKAK